MTARERFNVALGRLLEGDQMPPCAGSGAWTSDDAEERATAAPRCLPCPLLEPCGDMAAEERHKHGVWAGVDRTRPAGTRRRKAS